MRARDMITKLERLPARQNEIKIPDFSLLAPADQDRADELLHLIGCCEDADTDEYQSLSSEFWSLIEGLPWLGRNDPDQGPTIEVPHDLQSYWISSQRASEWRDYSFSRLGKVQTLRFVELCRAHGYEDSEGGRSPGDRTRQVKAGMVSLPEWGASEQAEMVSLLDLAAGSHRT